MSRSSLARKNLNNQAPRNTFKEERKAKMDIVNQIPSFYSQKDIAQKIVDERYLTESFVKSLIHENAHYHQGGFSLVVSSLSRIEKKLFLSYIVDLSEYEWLCENDNRLYAAFDEYKAEMQSLIDHYIDDVWHETMQESGLTMGTHKDNGEIYYYKG
jgi:hypothetical protein